MRTFSTLGAYLIAAAWGCASASAQAPRQIGPDSSTDEQAALLAVAKHLRDGLRSNSTVPASATIAVATAVEEWDRPPGRAPSRLWPAGALDAAAGILNARIVALNDVYRCDDPVRFWYCSLTDADVLLILGQPRIEGDTAVVTVNFVKRFREFADPNEAFSTKTLKELRRRDGGWVVTGNRGVLAQ